MRSEMFINYTSNQRTVQMSGVVKIQFEISFNLCKNKLHIQSFTTHASAC